mgnify:CR=1 FL=1
MATNIIKLNKGSDFSSVIIWKDSSGNAVDLTGYTVAIYGADDYLAANMTASITNASAGEITLGLEWSESMGTRDNQHYFRVRITQGSYDVSTNLLYFEVT